jgi:hypothetical protein
MNFLVPAGIMHFAAPRVSPTPSSEVVNIKPGAKRIMGLFFPDHLRRGQLSQYPPSSAYTEHDDRIFVPRNSWVLPETTTGAFLDV